MEAAEAAGRGGGPCRVVRTRGRFDFVVIALVCLLVAASFKVPALFRHLTREEPLCFTTWKIDSELVERPRGKGYRFRLGKHLPPDHWQGQFAVVLEDGEPLQPAKLQHVRRVGEGSYFLRGGMLHFAPTGNTDPRSNGRTYELKRPCALPAAWRWGGGIAVGLVVLGLLLRLLWGLARALGPPRGLALLRFSGYGLLALGSFLVSNHFFEWSLPPAQNERLGRKMAEFKQLKDRIDTVFIGSSRPYRHLDPRVFDAVFAQHGIKRFSYNMGIPLMRMLEVDYLVRWMLAQEPGRLRWLIVEPEGEVLKAFGDNLMTTREIRLHDPENMLFLVRQLWQHKKVPVAIYEISRHLKPFVFHLAHVGRGSEAVEAWLREGPSWDAGHRGFFSLNEEARLRPTEEIQYYYDRLHKELPEYFRLIDRLAESSPAGQLEDPAEIELFARLEKRLAPHGIRVIYLLSPQPHRRPNVIWAHEQGIIQEVMRFDDPKEYDFLFQPELRFDRHHLNEKGARIFTEMVAQRLLDSEATEAPQVKGAPETP